MKKMLKVMFPIILISVLLIAGCSGDSETADPEVGDSETSEEEIPAPDFQLESLEGQTVRLSELRGRVVLLNFWTTQCGWCVQEMPLLQQAYEEWQEAGLTLLTINIGESAETVTDFLQDKEFSSLPVLLDTERTVAAQYSISNIPCTFLIDQDGMLQAVKIGAFTSIEEIEAGLSTLLAK
jgi:peroxiredoxin